MQRRAFLQASGALCVSAACAPSPAWAEARSRTDAAFDRALARAQRGLLRHEPEQSTILGFRAQDNGPRVLHRWGRYGVDGRTMRRERLQAVVNSLQPFSAQDLDPRRARIQRVLMERAQGWLDLERAAGQGHLSPWGVIWGHEFYPINQISGLHIGGPSLLINYHPVETRADADAYIDRLDSLGPALDAIVEEMQVDASVLAPPRRILEGARSIAQSVVDAVPSEHPVVASFRIRVAAAGLSERYAALAERTFAARVQPAYRRLVDAISALIPSAPEPLGLAHRPNGAESYQLALRMQADTHLSPEDIHRIGLDEVRRLTEALNRACDALDLPSGAIPDRLAALTQRPGQLYPDTDDGRAALLADLAGFVETANRAIPAVFDRMPERAPVIRRIPSFLEPYASGGGGQPPSLDGGKAGVFVINLRDMATVARWSLPALTFHEATPGHIYEGEIAMSGNHPSLQLLLARSNGFAEGWAMYSEALAGELGLYDAIEGAEVGRLRSEQFRAARLVVDTGLHHFGWSFEQAVDYMVESGAARTAEAQREVLRYAAWPGQAVGYKLGMLAIMDAREAARVRQAPNFSMKDFHSRILDTGGIPIPELLRAIDAT
jgi:uncharacterized protein (DUF885 family)